MPSFYDYFKENMSELGLPAPESLFGTVGAAVSVIGSIAVATGRTLGNGTSLADVVFTARRYKLPRKWLVREFARRGHFIVTVSQ